MADDKKETNEPSEQKAETKTSQSGGGGNLTGPEGVLMFCVAGILDGIGFILFLLFWLGIDDYGILDVLGMIIIGGWMFVRGGGANKNIIKRGLRRFGFAAVVELAPFLGGIAPSWTILVWKELKS